VYFVRN